MRNLTLFTLLVLGHISFGQVLVFHENFDLPSGADSITAGSIGGASPNLGTTSNQLYVSPGHSYQISGSQTITDVYFETPSFSTVGQPYVRLEFYHIAKLFSANQATIQISTDNGGSWTNLTASNSTYLGTDLSFPSLGYFNQGSHQTTTSSPWASSNSMAQPTNSWFIKEIFDLTGIASDTTGGPGNFTGYSNVKLRFNAKFNFQIPPLQGFSAGWFIDDVSVLASTCELSPPEISFNYTPIPCYVPNPQGSVPGVSSNAYYIGAQVTDNALFPSGIDSVTCYFRKNGGALQHQNLSLIIPALNEYRTTLNNIFQGDTVEYYLIAWDLGCPNITRSPDTGTFSFTPAVYPSKCNSSLCSAQEVINTFPWTEDFEGPEWVPGTGTGDLANNSHRGDFPVVPDGPWNVAPPESGFYGWSIRTGPTGTQNTGPNGDHTTGNGKYLYTEFSPNPSSTFNRGTTFESPCIDLTDSVTRMLTFYYHSYGAESSNIRIDIDTGSTGTAYWLAYSRVKGQQQFSSADPWKKAYVSLEPFKGKVVKARFFVGSTISLYELLDHGIDDLEIDAPSQSDAQLVSIDSPNDEPCGATSSVPVKISIRNLGSDTLNTVPVAYQLDNGQILRDTMFSAIGLADSASITFGDLLSFNSAVSHNLKVWLEMPGDQNSNNDTLDLPISSRGGNISQFPYYLDFETSQAIPGSAGNLNSATWTMNDESVGTRFEIVEGPFDNSLNGPYQAFGPNKKALRLANLAGNSTAKSSFRSQCLDLSGMTTPSLSFMHYVYSGTKLYIRVREVGSDWTTLSTVNGVALFKHEMTMSRITLSAYAGKTIQLEFLVDENQSDDWTNKVVIDNILIAEANQPELAINSEIGSLRRLSAGITTLPAFDITLFKSMNVSVSSTQLMLEFTSACNPNAPVITGSHTFNPSFPFNTTDRVQAIPAINLSDTLRKDLYNLKVWLVTNGDTIRFNDTLNQECIVQTLTTVPYFNDFEACDEAFLSNGSNRQWQKGTPSAGAYSGSLSWVTNLDTGLTSGTQEEKLITPFFVGLDTLAGVEFRFFHRYYFNPTGFPNTANNYGTIEYLDNGNWKPLVTPTNPPYMGSGMVYDNQLGYVFVGNSAGNWQYFMTPLDQAKKPGVNVFRFVTKSLDTYTSNWEIDNFGIYVPPQYSASPFNLIFNQGIPSTSNSVSLELNNTGAKALNNCTVRIFDGSGNLLLTDTLVAAGSAISPRSRRIIAINDSLKLNPGINNLTIVTSRPNNRIDAFPIDDTLVVPINVLPLVSSIPYCLDFESGSGMLSFTNGRSDLFWQRGTPSKTIFNSANSGTNTWVTGLTNPYPPLANNYLYTSPILINGQTCYELSFQHWIESEEDFDGGNVEFSLDDGATWSVLGSDQDSLWYNTPYVQALDAIHPGFSGSTGGWVKAAKQFKVFGPGHIQFRFRFASSATIHGDGWMIDDLCLEQVAAGCQGINVEALSTINAAIHLYPNPAESELSVHLSADIKLDGQVRFRLINAVGQTVMEFDEDLRNDNLYRIDISTLPAGSYLMEVTSGQMSWNKSFIRK